MGDLTKLREAVERGETITSELLGLLPKHEEIPVRRLFLNIIHNGKDMTSALALHDALLPGWWWAVGTCKVSDDARVSPHDARRAPDGGEWADYTDVDLRPSGNPARAWLLAILRAMEGRE